MFTAAFGSTIHMDNALLDNWNTNATDMDGFNNLNLMFEGGGSSTCEVAGMADGGFHENFALNNLTVSDGSFLQLVDWRDNGNGATECLFTNTLDISSGSSLDLNGLSVYVNGNVETTLDSWISDGRLFDNTGIVNTVYSPGNNWTIAAVPEPSSLLLAVTALGIGLVDRARRRRQEKRH